MIVTGTMPQGSRLGAEVPVLRPQAADHNDILCITQSASERAARASYFFSGEICTEREDMCVHTYLSSPLHLMHEKHRSPGFELGSFA